MLDSIRIGHFISEKRKELKMTQQQLADKLKVSFQAVSKWENGSAYPNLEVLYELSVALGVKVDDILSGCEKSGEGLSYSKAGIDITYTDTIKLQGNVEDEDMLRTFNCGVGFILVVSAAGKDDAIRRISQYYPCYEIGRVIKGDRKVTMNGRLSWL